MEYIKERENVTEKCVLCGKKLVEDECPDCGEQPYAKELVYGFIEGMM